MLQSPLLHSLVEERVPVTDTIFSRICRASPAEAVELAATLPEEDRVRLALFCNARSHLRAAGRAIASICKVETLTLEGGISGLVLHQQAALGPDTWGSSSSDTRQVTRRKQLQRLVH